jgi:CxxC-x17-CxxC domain-containing protein
MASKTISCVQCQAEFEFTDEDRARLESLVEMKKIDQWTEPKRCLPCRQARKKAGGSGSGAGSGGGRQELFVASCSTCGGEAKVPFKPRGDRPVYCSSCFSEQRK